MRIMDERSWASKMGEEDGVGMGWLGTWGLGRRAELVKGVCRSWAGELGLWRRGSAAWVRGVG